MRCPNTSTNLGAPYAVLETMANFLVFMGSGVACAHPVAARLPHPRPALHHGRNVFSRQLASFADFGGGLCFFAAIVRLLIAVCIFSATQSRVLADRRAAARHLSGAVRVGGHAQRQHRILHGFIRRATGLFGAICGASLFLCACQKYIMLRQISGAGCLPTRRFYMKGF